MNGDSLRWLYTFSFSLCWNHYIFGGQPNDANEGEKGNFLIFNWDTNFHFVLSRWQFGKIRITFAHARQSSFLSIHVYPPWLHVWITWWALLKTRLPGPTCNLPTRDLGDGHPGICHLKLLDGCDMTSLALGLQTWLCKENSCHPASRHIHMCSSFASQTSPPAPPGSYLKTEEA